MRFDKIFAIGCLCLLGCGGTTNNDNEDRLPEPDIRDRLTYEKSLIDSSRMARQLDVRVYARVQDNPTPMEVRDLKWPENLDEVYNLWLNKDSQIVCFGAYPVSQSGDWDMGLTHYFDQNGQTFAFERNTSFYNSLCTDDLAIEQIVTYYYKDAKLDSIYTFTDVKGNQLEPDSCAFPYDFPYRIYTNVDDVLKSVGLYDLDSSTNHRPNPSE